MDLKSSYTMILYVEKGIEILMTIKRDSVPILNGREINSTNTIKGSLYDDPFFIGFHSATRIIRKYTGTGISETRLLVWNLIVTFKLTTFK